MSRTPRERSRLEISPIKGSRFIATLAPVSDEASARRLVAEVEAQMPDATHHCWALRLARPALERAVDAGEPSGSAGRPILAAMTGRDVVDACVVVTRYYGGTKLGVGGLVRAYGRAAAAGLDAAALVERVDASTWTIEHGYEDGPAVERTIARLSLRADEATFGVAIRRTLEVPVARADEVAGALRDATAGRIRIARDGANSDP
ncbi:MAG: YigZ family protein [Myxococcales bacterium]|nr:YigZ family protein [Myxococcales bacterium]MCB9716268.1 YigZ family protein [Myxococcales bacterium]